MRAPADIGFLDEAIDPVRDRRGLRRSRRGHHGRIAGVEDQTGVAFQGVLEASGLKLCSRGTVDAGTRPIGAKLREIFSDQHLTVIPDLFRDPSGRIR